MLNIEKFSSEALSCPILCKFCENFRRFAASEALFCPIFCKKWKIFGASFHLKYVMKNFNGTGVKKQGRNWHILVPAGGQIGTFGQNIYPCTIKMKSPRWALLVAVDVTTYTCIYTNFIALDQITKEQKENMLRLYNDEGGFLGFPTSMKIILTISVVRPSKGIFPFTSVFLCRKSVEMYAIFPFSSMKIVHFPFSAK